MNRASFLFAAAAFVILLAAAYVWLTANGGTAALPRLDPAVGPSASAAMAGLLAGFIGAALANRFNIGRRGREADLAKLLAALEAQSREAADRGPASRLSPSPPAPARRPPDELRTEPYWHLGGEPRPRVEPPQRPAAESSGSPPAAVSQEPRRPLPTVPNLNEVSAAYSRVVSGNISRRAFADFFETIGRSGPAEISDGGRSIEGVSGGESFLTCVNAGSVYLVFPSYDFIANQATQFATIASVPENVAAVFALERGDGELILDRPAVYEDSETGLRLVSKGEIRGFGG